MDTPCKLCKGTLHVRTAHGAVRCECAREIFAQRVKPELRGKDTIYPPEYDAKPPWALEDLVVDGTFMQGLAEFRYQAWRSLLVYLDHEVRAYEVVEANRLADIRYNHDSVYMTTQELETLDLVILFYGLSPLTNKLVPDLVDQLLCMRRLRGLPTWVYAGRALHAQTLNSSMSRSDDEQETPSRVVSSNPQQSGLRNDPIRR